MIDVTYILENYTKLKKAMEFYKSQAQQVEDKLKQQQSAIQKKAEGLKALQPGTPDYKKLEEELWSVVGVGELTDTTQATLFRLGIAAH